MRILRAAGNTNCVQGGYALSKLDKVVIQAHPAPNGQARTRIACAQDLEQPVHHASLQLLTCSSSAPEVPAIDTSLSPQGMTSKLVCQQTAGSLL